MLAHCLLGAPAQKRRKRGTRANTRVDKYKYTSRVELSLVQLQQWSLTNHRYKKTGKGLVYNYVHFVCLFDQKVSYIKLSSFIPILFEIFVVLLAPNRSRQGTSSQYQNSYLDLAEKYQKILRRQCYLNRDSLCHAFFGVWNI